MLDSVSAIARFATQLSTQKITQHIQMAVLDRAQDVEKQQGQAVLQLLESAVAPATHIDVRV